MSLDRDQRGPQNPRVFRKGNPLPPFNLARSTYPCLRSTNDMTMRQAYGESKSSAPLFKDNVLPAMGDA